MQRPNLWAARIASFITGVVMGLILLGILLFSAEAIDATLCLFLGPVMTWFERTIVGISIAWLFLFLVEMCVTYHSHSRRRK